ncbi:MAG: sigma 54-interacting transcriptional regulator [Acidobacteriota bacterium]
MRDPKSPGEANREGPILLHPGLPPGRAGEVLSPQNLAGERETARFAVGLFSALAFLEAEGWPFRPGLRFWGVGRDGLPLPAAAEAGAPEEAPARTFGALVLRLLSPRGTPRGAAPPLPRNLRRREAWRAFAGRCGEGGGGEFPCRSLLLGLLDIASSLEALPPPRWSYGVLADGAGLRRRPGLHLYPAQGGWEGEALRAEALLPSGGEGPLRAVSLQGIAPYPLAALEPLLALCLGSEEAARRWMGERLGSEGKRLEEDLAALLGRREEEGWWLDGAERLDAASRKVLHGAARTARKTVAGVLFHGPGRSSPLGVRLLWLPPVGEAWYRDHAAACLGAGWQPLLEVLEREGTPPPRAGAPLFPPLETVLPAAEEAEPRPEEMDRRTPSHLLRRAKRLLAGGREEAARFWEGQAFLSAGQPSLALTLWRSVPPGAVAPGLLPLGRARAFGALHDYGSLAQVLLETEGKEETFSPPVRALLAIQRAVALWLAGRAEEARKALEREEREEAGGDVPLLLLANLATICLRSMDTEGAVRALDQAFGRMGSGSGPFALAVLHHRRGLLRQLLGDLSGALEDLQAALGLSRQGQRRGLETGILCDLGNLLRRSGRSQEAEGAYRAAEEGALALGLSAVAQAARFNGAIVMLERGLPRRALPVFQAALREDLSAKNPLYAATDAFYTGLALEQMGRFPEALEAVERGLALAARVEEPQVLHELLVLKADLLVETGGQGALRSVLRRLSTTPWPSLEADDRLFEAALLGPRGAASPAERERLLAEATPLGRAFWYLHEAPRSGAPEEALRRALEAARELESPYLALRALRHLARRGAFPFLEEGDRERYRRFLVENDVRGPERDLLPLLEPPGGVVEAAPAPPCSSDLSVLEAARRGDGEALELLARHLGATVCLESGTGGVRFAGDGTAAGRRALLEGRGRPGIERTAEGTRVGAVDGMGRWVGVWFPAGRYLPAEAETLLGLWIRLLPTLPPPPSSVPTLPPVLRGLLLTRSPAMAPLVDLLVRAAPFRFPVLVTGEPGTGKEVCAQALHLLSPRAKRPWVPANCANLSPTLAASLLFGHRRGAFTGAERDQPGLVEAARESTLFLDEVGELPLEVQASLLRFLQDGSFLPLGEVRPRESDARIVAATNRDLAAAAEGGLFRRDLFHRLNVIRLEVPPLRRRPEDIPLLLSHFLERAAASEGLPVPRVHPDLLQRLGAYPWPGNVRELQNTARALLVASRGEALLLPRHLPASFGAATAPADSGRLARAVREAEARAIAQALEEAGGHPTEAARLLGLTRQGLFAKMKRLGLRRSTPGGPASAGGV